MSFLPRCRGLLTAAEAGLRAFGMRPRLSGGRSRTWGYCREEFLLVLGTVRLVARAHDVCQVAAGDESWEAEQAWDLLWREAPPAEDVQAAMDFAAGEDALMGEEIRRYVGIHSDLQEIVGDFTEACVRT